MKIGSISAGDVVFQAAGEQKHDQIRASKEEQVRELIGFGGLRQGRCAATGLCWTRNSRWPDCEVDGGSGGEAQQGGIGDSSGGRWMRGGGYGCRSGRMEAGCWRRPEAEETRFGKGFRLGYWAVETKDSDRNGGSWSQLQGWHVGMTEEGPETRGGDRSEEGKEVAGSGTGGKGNAGGMMARTRIGGVVAFGGEPVGWVVVGLKQMEKGKRGGGVVMKVRVQGQWTFWVGNQVLLGKDSSLWNG